MSMRRTPCRRFNSWAVVLVFAAAVGAAAPAYSNPPSEANRPSEPPAGVVQLQQTFIDVIERSQDAVVSIARFKEFPRVGRSDMGLVEGDAAEPGPDFIPNSFGSGIIVAPLDDPSQLFILTNYHVVKGGPAVGMKADAGESYLYVRPHNRRGFYTRILAADPRSDLAVLQMDSRDSARQTPYRPLKFGDGNGLKKGQLVVALGNPYAIARDGSPSASWGMISNFSRRPALPPADLDDDERRRRETIHHFGTLLQTDTRLNLGTSGGALLNLKGELIGVTTSLAALEGYEKSVGYAIPIDRAVARIVRELAQGYEVEYGFLGIQPQNVEIDRLRGFPASVEQRSAARATYIIPNSPASAGRLQPNDVIVSVDGRPVHSGYDLIREIALLAPGSKVALEIWRQPEDSLLTRTVELGKWPVRDEEGVIATRQRHAPWQGASIDYPTARERYFQGPDYRYHSAVVVARVEPGSNADRAKLQEGDFIARVNGVPVPTPAKFHAAVEGLSPQDKVRLDLVDGRQIVVSP